MENTTPEILSKLPDSPGIYEMLNKEGKIIYVGKAKNLRKRVKQYFKTGYTHSQLTKKLLENISDIKFTVVDSELEALILETTLIKQHQPKYNILMKDDKNYIYIKITKEDFPRIQLVRKVENDNAKYIGPKTAAHKVRETLKILKRVFPFRHCGLDIEWVGPNEVKITNKVLKYPCIDYYIKTCPAPCIGNCTKEQYKEATTYIQKFMEGKVEGIVETLHSQMEEYARKKDFERAAKLRDRIKKIRDIMEKQKVSTPLKSDADIINYVITNGKAFFNLFQIRNGKLLDQENFILQAEDYENQNKEILESFLLQYYNLAQDFPKEIIIPHEPEENKTLLEFIKSKSSRNIKFIIPKMGNNDKLLEMSLKNAQIFADRNRLSWQDENKLTAEAVQKLQNTLGISAKLKRIECYDISHLSGTDTVGSMVVFENGVPKKNMYRKFHLRSVQGRPDDYKSLEEVLIRRLSKLAENKQKNNFRFKKATKKDQAFIEKNNDIKFPVEDREFYILEKISENRQKSKSKEQIGFIAIKEYPNKISELTNLWIKKDARGEKLGQYILKKTIEKTRGKRAYIICKQALREYYLNAGFEEIKKIPQELKQRFIERSKKTPDALCLAYDKNKHKTDESFSKIPDLIVIDGGKGQLNICKKVLLTLKLDIKPISLAKENEEIYLPDKEKPLRLTRQSEELRLLQRLRDEAHRFAISYNVNLRHKRLKS